MGKKEQTPLSGYEVLLCVTGGIACYKSADLASKLVQAGAGVNVAMTDAAGRFLTPLTFQSLVRRRVYTSLWDAAEDFRSQHIALTERADLMVVAPATANILAKMAHGIADDLVSTLVLAATGECPILAAPAMNTRMWNAPATRENVERLTGWGVHVVGPAEGRLACGTVGVGRMIDPDEILAAATELLRKNPPKKKRR
ncbi:MAG TPA: flavoprotein [Phycisphaerae bacterium]|nr:flavoprotein [Phycisphaerae bacterium]HUU59389.1 flavoprotein [Phycisphaerae bacterium]